MTELVSGERSRYCKNCGTAEDRNTKNLRHCCGIAHLLILLLVLTESQRIDRSRTRRIVGMKKLVEYPVVTTPMYILDISIFCSFHSGNNLQGSAIYLPIRKDSRCSTLIECVHLGVASIRGKLLDKQSALFIGKKLCCLGPVNNPELRNTADDNGGESFDNKDPAPCFASRHTAHICNCVGKKLFYASAMALVQQRQ